MEHARTVIFPSRSEFLITRGRPEHNLASLVSDKAPAGNSIRDTMTESMPSTTTSSATTGILLRSWSALALTALLVSCGEGLAPSAADNTAGTGPNGTGTGGTGTGPVGSSGGGGVGQGGTTGGMPVVTAYDVGFAPVTRLNRVQYDNTVADLLGTTLTPATRFPADNLALGFDTIGAVLNVSPEHAEAYLAASRDLITELMARAATDPIKQRYFTCDVATGAACQLEVLRNFASAAWRRPVGDAELTAYAALVAAQPTPDEGNALGLRAILSSANFIYRIERDGNADDATPHTLSAHELATRLSYFLTSSTPDSELRAAADAGTLGSPETLVGQVTRLLADAPRARQFVDNFGTQWLNINRVTTVTPDPTMFPEFDAALRDAMAEESKLFFGELVSSNLPVAQMFTADFKYLNARLATHYDIAGVTGEQLQRVSVTAANNRLGVLTQGAFLAGTSNPTRTSPVKRGLTVLDRLLCSAPPPPPAGVDTNIDEGSGLENLSVRERLEQHVMKGDTCNACHSVIDPIGLGLENFDAVGKFRMEDEYGAIDATGSLPGADNTPVAFNGAAEMAALLAMDPRINACVSQQVLTYALGRKIGASETGLREAVTVAMQTGGGTVRSAIDAVVSSEAFRSRRAASAAEVMP